MGELSRRSRNVVPVLVLAALAAGCGTVRASPDRLTTVGPGAGARQASASSRSQGSHVQTHYLRQGPSVTYGSDFGSISSVTTSVTAPADSAGRSLVTLSLDYRTSGASDYALMVTVGRRRSGTPHRRLLPQSPQWRSTTVQFLLDLPAGRPVTLSLSANVVHREGGRTRFGSRHVVVSVTTPTR